MKELYPWDKADKAIDYNKELFQFLCIKNAFSLAWDIILVFFLFARMWDWSVALFTNWDSKNWCLDDWYVQYPSMIVFAGMIKLFDILVHVFFGVYQTFFITKKYGFSEATPCTFIREKLMVFVGHMILTTPLILLITASVELTGKYIILIVIVLTPIVKFILLYLYPKIIMPLFSNFKVFPTDDEEKKFLLGRIRALA